MTEYDEQRERLAQMIKPFESQIFPDNLPEDVKKLISEMKLLPSSDSKEEEAFDKLTGDRLCFVIGELGYDEKYKEGEMLVVKSEVGPIKICYNSLPMIYISNDNLSLERVEGLDSMNKAAADVTLFWSMVKVVVDPNEHFIVIWLEARHEDEASFRQNFPFYLYQIIHATQELQERYNEYEAFRKIHLREDKF